KVLGDFDNVYAIKVDPEFGFSEFSEDEWKTITLINGKRSINDITAAAGSDELEVCKTLKKLYKMKVIRLIEPPERKKKEVARNYGRPYDGVLKKLVFKLRSA
ncbi:MAG: hypothetical protein GY771_12795, partial [bacterium]|nr:hypothetical protein [bacterium]